MIVALFQFIFLMYFIGLLQYLLGVSRDSFPEVLKSNSSILAVAILGLIYIINLMYFKGERLERVLEKYEPDRILTKVNGLVIFGMLFILPLLFIYLIGKFLP